MLPSLTALFPALQMTSDGVLALNESKETWVCPLNEVLAARLSEVLTGNEL